MLNIGPIEITQEGNNFWYHMLVTTNSVNVADKFRTIGHTRRCRVEVNQNSRKEYTIEVACASELILRGTVEASVRIYFEDEWKRNFRECVRISSLEEFRKIAEKLVATEEDTQGLIKLWERFSELGITENTVWEKYEVDWPDVLLIPEGFSAYSLVNNSESNLTIVCPTSLMQRVIVE